MPDDRAQEPERDRNDKCHRETHRPKDVPGRGGLLSLECARSTRDGEATEVAEVERQQRCGGCPQRERKCPGETLLDPYHDRQRGRPENNPDDQPGRNEAYCTGPLVAEGLVPRHTSAV